MSTFSKQLLSGSTNGRGIRISTTSNPGNLIHTAVSGTSNMDEIWLYAAPTTTSSSATLTFQYGDTTDTVPIIITSNSGLILCFSGLLLNNSLVIRAYSSEANAFLVFGYVNRITV